MKKRILAGMLALCMALVLLPVSAFAVTPSPPDIAGPTAMTLTLGYSTVSTAAYTLTGVPYPAVTQDKTWDGKIVWNNTTEKLDITAGLPVGSYPVVLTADNGSSITDTLTFTLTVAATGALTTLFATDNAQRGNMFDMEVVGTSPIRVNSFDINLEGASSTVSVYYREGGYSGFENNASAWTLIGSQSGVTSAGYNLPTPLAVGGVTLQPGIRYGFYMSVSDEISYLRYTEMPVGTEYSDDTLKIISGIGHGNPAFAGMLYANRAWNGTVYYTPLADYDASLSNLTVTGAALNEIFSPTVTAYTVTAPLTVTSITLGASKNNPNATMTLQVGSGTPAAWDGSASAQTVNVGVNVFTITVTAQDGTTQKTYTVTVTRNEAPTLVGQTAMTLTWGYAATSTTAYTVTGGPVPAVTQDTTHGGKIVWNDTTKKLDIAAGLTYGVYPITLTAANGVTPDAAVSFTLTVSADSLTTTFDTGNQFAGNMFDMEVVGPYPLHIDSFDVNLEGGSCTIKVYYRAGGYLGFEKNASAWTLLGTQTGVVPAGTDQPTPVAIGGVTLEPGILYGFYVCVSNYSAAVMHYANMPAGTEYSDGSLKIIAGNGRGNAEFAGYVFPDRIWSGTVYYTPEPTAPSISGPSETALLAGYAATSTADFTVMGFPAPTVTQDTTYGGKIVWNNATQKLDIAAGLAAGTYSVTLTAANDVTPDATLTFTLKVWSSTPVTKNLLTLTPPAAITGLANGTAKTAAALGLPLLVTLVTDNGNETGAVVWDLASCAYTPSTATAQTFTVSGVVTLPLNVANPNRTALTVTISVSVNAASASQAVTSSASTSSAVTSIVNSTGSGESVPAMGDTGGSAMLSMVIALMLSTAGVFVAITLRKRGKNAAQ